MVLGLMAGKVMIHWMELGVKKQRSKERTRSILEP